MSSVAYQRDYYEQHLRRARGYQPRVSRGPAVAHIKACLAVGMSIKSITERSGVPEATIRTALARPDGKMLTITEQSILSVRPQQPVTAPGITRRIRALNALGWSTPIIAAETGLCVETIKRWRRGEVTDIRRGIVEPILAVYADLSMRVPEPTTTRERISVTRSAGEAKRYGWVPPLAWDDDEIDNPYAVPDTGDVTRGVDIDEWVHLVKWGEDPTRAATRLGVGLAAIERAAERAGRPDVATLARPDRSAA